MLRVVGPEYLVQSNWQIQGPQCEKASQFLDLPHLSDLEGFINFNFFVEKEWLAFVFSRNNLFQNMNFKKMTSYVRYVQRLKLWLGAVMHVDLNFDKIRLVLKFLTKSLRRQNVFQDYYFNNALVGFSLQLVVEA